MRQHSIPQVESEALLGVGPMNICVFEPASRAPIAWYSYDDLKWWDFSQQTLTLSLEVDK